MNKNKMSVGKILCVAFAVCFIIIAVGSAYSGEYIATIISLSVAVGTLLLGIFGNMDDNTWVN